jgi:hypothetical protein
MRNPDVEEVIQMINEHMIRDGLPRSFVESIEHRTFSELLPELMMYHRLMKEGKLRPPTAMPPLRYEYLGRRLMT